MTDGHENRLGYAKEGLVVRLLVSRMLVSSVLAVAAVGGAGAAEPDLVRRAQLVSMVRQDCGSCHGLRLTGGLGPALLPDSLSGKPAAALIAAVLGGRPGTAMPGWSRFLSGAEAAWIVEQLQRGFPPLAERGGW